METIEKLEQTYIDLSKKYKMFYDTKTIEKGDINYLEIIQYYESKFGEILKLEGDERINQIKNCYHTITGNCIKELIKKYHEISGNYGGLDFYFKITKISETIVLPHFAEFLKKSLEINE